MNMRAISSFFPDNTATISLLNTFYFSYLDSRFIKFLFFKWDKEQMQFFLLFYIDNQLSRHLCWFVCLLPVCNVVSRCIKFPDIWRYVCFCECVKVDHGHPGIQTERERASRAKAWTGGLVKLYTSYQTMLTLTYFLVWTVDLDLNRRILHQK